MIESQHWAVCSFHLEGLLKTNNRKGEGEERAEKAQERELAYTTFMQKQ